MNEVDMLGPLDIHQHLLAHDVRHEIVRVRRSTPTAAQLPEALAVSPQRCVLCHLFVITEPAGRAGGTEHKLLLVMAIADTDPTDARLLRSVQTFLEEGGAAGPVKRRRLRKQPRGPIVVTAAPPELISSRTDYLASHLAPLLLPVDVLVVAEPELAELGTEIVYTATGDGGTALALRATDLLDVTRARLLERVEEPLLIVLDPPVDPNSAARFGPQPTLRSGDQVTLPNRDPVQGSTT
jgi:Cys-tRNA(Pro)/Cys-tRNA(Cys) deacylase